MSEKSETIQYTTISNEIVTRSNHEEKVQRINNYKNTTKFEYPVISFHPFVKFILNIIFK